MYIPINVVDAIIHEWFRFVQAYVLMVYLHGKSYCWLVFPFSCRCNKYECQESKVKFLRGKGNDVLIATLKI